MIPLQRVSTVLATVVALGCAAHGQLRVLTHNISNYAGGRASAIQTALFASFEGRSAKPDLFLGQEFINASALSAFTTIMNTAPGSAGTYAFAPFVDGPDTDSVLVYRSDKVVLDGTVVVATGGTTPKQPRNIMRYDLHLVGYTQAGTGFSVYSSHFKAGQENDDHARRLLETQLIRDDAETLGRPFFIGGDFNIQSSNETSFVELTGSQANNLGRFFDPIKTSGTWNNNNSLRFVHTQDPATGQAGMDDRYDFVLFSAGLVDAQGFDYIGNKNLAYSTTTWNDPNHSYRAWGNDGTSYNTALKVVGNQMVGPDIAQALIDCCGGQSGHLPVLVQMQVPAKVSVPASINFGTVFLGQTANRTLNVANSANVSLWNATGIDSLDYSMSATSGITVPGGNFIASPGGSNNHTVSLNTSVVGPRTGTITVASDDPDFPAVQIPFSGYVLPIRPNQDGNTIH